MYPKLSKILFNLGRLIAVASLGIGIWYIVGDLSNPLISKTDLSNNDIVRNVLLWPFGLLAYLSAGCTLSMLCIMGSRLASIGLEGYLKEQSALNKIQDVGTLLKVSVDRGGCLDSTISTIETTTGFFRVFGNISTAKKGTTVGLKKKYDSLTGYEVLCLQNKEYQLV